MGAALVRGIVQSGRYRGADIIVCDVDATKTKTLQDALSCGAVRAPEDAITGDTRAVVIAVKPQDVPAALGRISPKVHDRLPVISIAAGLSTGFLLERLPPGTRVIRAMPNAGAMVGMSATALCKGGAADDEDLEFASNLFGACGTVSIVPENRMNAVTALSGSGPGYLFCLMEAFTDAGVAQGLDRATARTLTVQTFAAAAETAARGNEPFSLLKDRITSPGGTTMAGLRVLERGGVRGLIMDAIEAATRRGFELESREKA
jgi:pyrroline-5-carboxylate reductase